MHILLTSGVFVEYTIGLANALSKYPDTKITLVLPENYTSRLPEGSWENLLEKNVNQKLIRYAEPITRIRLQSFMAISHLVALIKKINPDIIHIQEGDLFVTMALPFAKKFPVIHTVHDLQAHPGFKLPWREAQRRHAIKYSDGIIVHGERLKKEAIIKFGLKVEDVHVIHHGNFSIFQKWSGKVDAKQEPFSLLFFGRIERYKGLAHLIEAEPLISREFPDLKIIIAGKGMDFAKYERMMINRERYECHIGFIPNETVPALFQRASIVVLPYIEASQSGVIPLAYSFGRPVVASDVGSIPELVDDGKTGLLVPAGDIVALATAIKRLLKDVRLRREMSTNAYLKAKTELSWEGIAGKTIQVYKEILSGMRLVT